MNMERFGPSAMWSYVTLGWALRYIIIATTVVMLHYTCFFHSQSYFVLFVCFVMLCNDGATIAIIGEPLSPSPHFYLPPLQVSITFSSLSFPFFSWFNKASNKILVIKIVYYRWFRAHLHTWRESLSVGCTFLWKLVWVLL